MYFDKKNLNLQTIYIFVMLYGTFHSKLCFSFQRFSFHSGNTKMIFWEKTKDGQPIRIKLRIKNSLAMLLKHLGNCLLFV